MGALVKQRILNESPRPTYVNLQPCRGGWAPEGTRSDGAAWVLAFDGRVSVVKYSAFLHKQAMQWVSAIWRPAEYLSHDAASATKVICIKDSH